MKTYLKIRSTDFGHEAKSNDGTFDQIVGSFLSKITDDKLLISELQKRGYKIIKNENI